MDRIGIFIAGYNVANSPSILNLLELLSEHYRLELFFRDVGRTNVPLLRKKSVRVTKVGSPFSCSYWAAYARAMMTPCARYIAFDPYGFWLCKRLYPLSRPIYYSLELYLKDDHYLLTYPADVMTKERSHIASVSGLVIQSEEREGLFRHDYDLPATVPSFILPVTYNGSSGSNDSLSLRNHYGIQKDVRIALHLGGIEGFHSCFDLAEAFGSQEDWALVFHGYPVPTYVSGLRSFIREMGIKNVFIHDDVFDDIGSVDEIVKSCDVGIAWYDNISANFRTAGMSSGKIPAYLRFGLPTVAKRYPSTVQALEDTGSGVCVKHHGGISKALRAIVRDYDTYSRAARKEYEARYRFENYEDGFLKFLESSHS